MQDKALRHFGQEPTTNFRFLTILLEISPPSATAVRKQIAECRKSLRNFFDHLSFNDIKFFGAFEVDVRTKKHSLTTPRSREVLGALGMDVTGGMKSNSDKPFYLPHLHAIVDIRGHDEDAPVRGESSGTDDKPPEEEH